MDRWEYKIVEKIDRWDLERELTDLGQEGWEAIGFAIEGTLLLVLLKRRTPQS